MDITPPTQSRKTYADQLRRARLDSGLTQALAAKIANGARLEAQDLSWDRRAEKIETFLSQRLAEMSPNPMALSA